MRSVLRSSSSHTSGMNGFAPRGMNSLTGDLALRGPAPALAPRAPKSNPARLEQRRPRTTLLSLRRRRAIDSAALA